MSLERLKNALKGVQREYYFVADESSLVKDGEHDLVRAGAEAHDVKLSEGGMFDPLEMTEGKKGAYNARIPKEGDNLDELAQALEKVESLTVICEDYRQSAQAASELGINSGDGKHAILASAGGCTQPTEGEHSARHASLVEFIAAFHEVNPTAIIRLIAHDGICGGHAYYIGTAKAAKEAKKSEGYAEATKAEDVVMRTDTRKLAADLVKLDSGIKAVLKGRLTKIGEQDEYLGIEWFDLFSKN